MTDRGVLEEGAIHDVLRNERRRLTLEQLRENGDSLSVRELSERVAALETGESPPPRNIRQSVYVSLHQTHLPKLDDLGIVEYDAEVKEVTLTERVRELEAYMNVEPTVPSRWAWYYLAIAALGLLTTVAIALGAPASTSVGVPAVAVIFFTLVLAVAAYQLRSDGNGPGRPHS